MVISAKEQTSRAIEILRFPLAVMVVAIHCYYFNTQEINQDQRGGVLPDFVKCIIDLFSIVLTDCAVPLFFVISGYLYFLKKPQISFKENAKKLRGKCVTLMLPYFIWNVVGIIAYPGRFLGASMTDKILGFWTTSFKFGGWAGPWDGPLWFIRDLFVVMAFAPIISYLIRKFRLLFPLLLLIPYMLHYEAICAGFSTVAFLYFSFGAYLAIKLPDFSESLNGRIATLWCISVAMVFFVMRWCVMLNVIQEWSRILNLGWILASMVLYFRIACKIGNTTHNFERWKQIGASSFVIFAMHSLVIGRISSTFLWLVGKENVGSGLTLLFYFMTITLAVMLCYCAHIIISKNKTAALLFEGGRTR